MTRLLIVFFLTVFPVAASAADWPQFRGPDPSGSNADGNTPLHAAAFLGREEVVKLLLDKGASLTAKNNKGETPVDVVSGKWDQGLADFYTAIGTGINQKLDLKQIGNRSPVSLKTGAAEGPVAL
jgi:ankyrin repeat protein